MFEKNWGHIVACKPWECVQIKSTFEPKREVSLPESQKQLDIE